MMKGKEKLSTKPSGVSITQSPTLPSLPPRNRSDTISRRFGANESEWSSDEEEDVYADDNNQQDFRRHLQETHQTIQEMMKIQRWKPFAGA
ncbi:hypothetical protein ERO13_D04G148666v2 [Gossypium hirsutum]|nr:hypothetical protein ERO13_D04G148666v2 [Gossypium hirsutum]